MSQRVPRWTTPWIGSALRAARRIAGVGALAAKAAAVAGAAARAGDRRAVRHARAELFSRTARRALAIHGVDCRAAGPLPRCPALLVANHVSYLDPLVVASQVPCVPVSKADLASWPVFGTVARRTGVIFVERTNSRSRLRVMREVELALQDGALVLNFPEGTTTDGSTVLPFRRGMFSVAHRLGVPVVPVAISYDSPDLAWTGDATFVPSYLRLAAMRQPLVHLAFGDPLPSRGYATAGALAEAAHARTLALLEERPACLRMTP
jgi:1-acyl-sn-glycerol-3-phosphate acyltransferase